MSGLTEIQRRAVVALINAVAELGTYIETPDLKADPSGRAVYKSGAEALRLATEAGFSNQ